MGTATGLETAGLGPKGFGGWLLLALLGLAALVAASAVEMGDALKMMLEWELLAVFVRPETHGWYRTVMATVAMDVDIGALSGPHSGVVGHRRYAHDRLSAGRPHDPRDCDRHHRPV
jgi:hypothetical protein